MMWWSPQQYVVELTIVSGLKKKNMKMDKGPSQTHEQTKERPAQCSGTKK